MIANLLIPSRALHWGVLTRPWPELDLWRRANPAMGYPILPEALWDLATDMALPPGVVEIAGHRYPLIEFPDYPGDSA